MKLTKDNYEFLMFELLEGNLSKTEKNILREQINKDEFYLREWALMQHAVATPNIMLMMDKRYLLKPEGRKIAFLSFAYIAKIAASILLIGNVGWWSYKYNNTSKIVNTPPETENSPEIKIIKTPTNDKNSLIQIAGDDHKAIARLKENTDATIQSQRNHIIKPISDSDSLPPANLPEILLIKPMENEGIAYDLKSNEVSGTKNLITEKTKTREAGKVSQLLARAGEIRTTAREYWHDIPNLKLKVTTKLKGKKPAIGFEIKGETIYANALLEIK